MSDRPFQELDAFSHPRDHSSRVVPLWVDGKPPYRLGLSDHTLAFGGRVINTPSEPMTLIVTNTGFQPLNIESVVVTGAQFTISPILPLVLEAGKTLTIPVVFTPTEYGVNYGTIVITTKEGIVNTIRLLGAGIWDHTSAVDTALEKLWGFLKRATRPALTTDGALVDLSNTGLEFKDEIPVGSESETMTLTITNAGNETLLIDNIAINGDFELVT